MDTDYLNIVTTEGGIYEYEGDKALVFIPKNEIIEIRFGFGKATRWPLMALLIGIVLIGAGAVLGILPLFNTITRSENVGANILKGYAFMALNIVPGVYFSYLGLRKQNCIFIETSHGIRKLIVRGLVDKDKMFAFLLKSSEKLNISYNKSQERTE